MLEENISTPGEAVKNFGRNFMGIDMEDYRLVENKIREKFYIQGEESPYTFGAGRSRLIRLFAYLGYTTGAEIGVHKGHYSLGLCSRIPNLKLYCVDPWVQFDVPERRIFLKYATSERMAEAYEEAKVSLAPYNVEFMRMTSEEASKIISDNTLDFVYIDALHDYENVLKDITLWEPKVRHGGIISGHDYANLYYFGVVDAVEKFVKDHNIESYFVTEWEKRRTPPSWFWVKR
jgi:hypothetical protein